MKGSIAALAGLMVAGALASGCASKAADTEASLAERVERAEFAAMEAQRAAQEAQRVAAEAKATADQAAARSSAGDEKLDRVFERSQQK